MSSNFFKSLNYLLLISLTSLFALNAEGNANVFRPANNIQIESKTLNNTNSKTAVSVEKPDEPINFDDINVEVKNETKTKLITETDRPIKTLKGNILQQDPESIKKAFEIQKKQDVKDITALWESTVERNNIIKFTVKKLAIPADQRRVHSSLMVRSLSTLVNGASLLPGVFGMDSSISTASAAGGSIASRIIKNKNLPKDMPISDTELIQLAGLIEELQNNIIKSYYDYKSSIEQLKECRSKLMLYNKNYSDALKNKSEANILVSSAMYDKQVVEEMKIKQQIKLHRLELERLAGPEIVSKLNLTKLNDIATIEKTVN